MTRRVGEREFVAILPAIYDAVMGANCFGYGCDRSRLAQRCGSLETAVNFRPEETGRAFALRAAAA
jgi:hypothetical protein